MSAHDVLEKVGNPGILGALGAGLSAVALYFGLARVHKKALPSKFPGDPEASQTKYILAFNQLNDAFAEQEINEATLAALDKQPALKLCTEAFQTYLKRKK
jgi:hypothetical protein